ncbi:DUF3464 family protein [Candidatus Gracilibacteria bacterium]|jgi:Photosynthesis affected mutant 68|nr:DUF3464 family protein [Candidatus Gracilibacteria bacterium]NJP19636.1 DUF3464 family protein [Hydrococcus sp. CRU_1_1]
MPSKSSRDRLAFEPNQKKKKTPKQPPIQPQKESGKTKNVARKKATERSIPESVSKRMIRRMAFFSGIPTGLAMSSFFVFYWIVSHEWLEIPASAVGAVTLGLFGLGVLGLSYGILSSSWDEDRDGGWIGAQEFKTNFGRMTAAWREAKEAEKQAKN